MHSGAIGSHGVAEVGWRKIVAPALATNGTRTIDFFVVSIELADAVAGIAVVGDALCKPHSPVRLYLKAEARTMTVRSLKNVETLGANLPYGPLPKPVREPIDPDKASNHELFDYFLHHAEVELGSLGGGSSGGVGGKAGSRTEGPKFVIRDALEHGEGGPRQTTAVSRAWRRTAG